eukprot:4075403-Pyramimonas_sp.AAC.1
MSDKDAKALDAHIEAFRASRGQRKRPRMGRGGKDARVPLERLPILTVRVDCTGTAPVYRTVSELPSGPAP